MSNQQIFTAFEESNMKYSSVVNTYQIRNWMTNLYGLNRDFDSNDLTNKLPYNTYNFLLRQVKNVGIQSNPYVGGVDAPRKAYINMSTSQQDYDILSFVDKNSGLTIREYLNSVSGTTNNIDFDIKTVFHYSPITLYRFYDPFSSINLLSQEFNFESFNTETIFYVLPLWNDILRAQQLNLNDKVRRSNVTYTQLGNILRIHPKPLITTKLWIEYASKINPFNALGSLSADPSISGISNITNVPYRDIKYSEINPPGRYWIRQQTFALCLEELGRIRRKFRSIPIPNGDVTLDGDELVREGIERQDKLEIQLKDDLEKLTNTSLLREEIEQMEIVNRGLTRMPTTIYLM